MSWTNAVLLVYVAGMAAFVVHHAELARENPDNDPFVAALPHSALLRFVLAAVLMIMSPVWPLWAAAAALRTMSRVLQQIADRR